MAPSFISFRMPTQISHPLHVTDRQSVWLSYAGCGLFRHCELLRNRLMTIFLASLRSLLRPGRKKTTKTVLSFTHVTFVNRIRIEKSQRLFQSQIEANTLCGRSRLFRDNRAAPFYLKQAYSKGPMSSGAWRAMMMIIVFLWRALGHFSTYM